MADTLYIYTCTDANNVVNKKLVYIKDTQVDVMGGTDCINPVFILHGDIDFIKSNYCYSSTFKRFYYIRSIKTLENGMFALYCNVDVLNTYSDYIRSGEHLIERQEHNYNPMLPDNMIKSRVGTVTDKKYVGNVGKTISYILTVTGGSGNE